MTVRGEETAAVSPEPGPDLFDVRLRKLKAGKFVPGKEFEAAFAMGGRQRIDSRLYLEQEHQPMGLTLVAVLTHQAGQVKIASGEVDAQLFVSFTAGAGIGRFSIVGVKFSATRAPEAEIGLLRPFKQKHFVALIEAVEQSGDFVRQCHWESVECQVSRRRNSR